MKINSVVAKQDNGNIQITYTIPADMVGKNKAEVVSEMAKDITIPGFRKGNAPLSQVESRIGRNKLIEHILSHILPKAFADSVEEHKIKPAIYPKFELVKPDLSAAIKVDDDKDWEIRAITCELPEVKLDDYKNKIAGELRSAKIVVPGKEEAKISDEQVINAILKTVKADIPKILVEEEVNSRLSALLERIEKLGLTLEGYLGSIKETAESLRKKYEEQAVGAITLELTLNKIAADEKIEVSEKEVEDFVKSTGNNTTKIERDQLETLKRVIQRRKALEKVASLV